MIYGTVGIHPHESSKDIITSKQIIESLVKTQNNEIGKLVRFYYNNVKKTSRCKF